MPDVEIIETDELPRCPHCEKTLNNIAVNTKGMWERHKAYMCPHCKKLLTIGYDTGFGN